MKLTNQRIINDAKRLGEMSQKQLPVKVSYAIAKNITKIEAELGIYNKQRQKLIDQYSEKDETGKPLADATGNVIWQEGSVEAWNKDIKELMAIENDVDIHKFPISALEGFNMTPAEIMLIDYMIED